MKKMRIFSLTLIGTAVAGLCLAQQPAPRPQPYIVARNGSTNMVKDIKSNGGILTVTRQDGQVQQLRRGEYLAAGGMPKPAEMGQAEAALSGKKYDEAIRLFQAVSRAHRGLDWDLKATLGLADAQVAKGDAAEAVKTFEGLLGVNENLKNNPDIVWGMRAAMLAAKQYGPLGRQLDAAARDGSREDAARAQNMRGDIQLAQNNVKEAAMDYLRTAILFEDVTNPDIQGEASYKAAEALTVLRDARAKDMYRRVVEKYPQSKYASLARGKM